MFIFYNFENLCILHGHVFVTLKPEKQIMTITVCGKNNNQSNNSLWH